VPQIAQSGSLELSRSTRGCATRTAVDGIHHTWQCAVREQEGVGAYGGEAGGAGRRPYAIKTSAMCGACQVRR